jgi:hypothetical protein
MRYEIKFVFPQERHSDVLRRIIGLPWLFCEVHPLRRVNNIYLDTMDFADYRAALGGVGNRCKTRIRWYGDAAGQAEKPVLERKIKEGRVGRKTATSMPPLTFGRECSLWDYLKQSIMLDRGDRLYRNLAGRRPVCFNSYLRRYFSTPAGEYRITLDNDVVYAGVGFFDGRRRGSARDANIIVELKFAEDRALSAALIADALGRPSRNSKYVNAVNALIPLALQ